MAAAAAAGASGGAAAGASAGASGGASGGAAATQAAGGPASAKAGGSAGVGAGAKVGAGGGGGAANGAVGNVTTEAITSYGQTGCQRLSREGNDPTGAINTLTSGVNGILSNGYAGAAILVSGITEDVRNTYRRQLGVAQRYYDEFEADQRFAFGANTGNTEGEYQRFLREYSAYFSQRVPFRPDPNFVTGSVVHGATAKIDMAWMKKRRVTSRYNVGEMKQDDIDFLLDRLTAFSTMVGFGERHEYVREEIFDNAFWNRRLAYLNIGIGQGNIAMSGLASSVSAIQESLGDIAGIKTSMGAGIGRAIGFVAGKMGAE